MSDTASMLYCEKCGDNLKISDESLRLTATIADLQQQLTERDAEITKRGEYIDALHKRLRELDSIVSDTPLDIVRDVDGTFFTQQVLHKELSIGNVFRIVIGG